MEREKKKTGYWVEMNRYSRTPVRHDFRVWIRRIILILEDLENSTQRSDFQKSRRMVGSMQKVTRPPCACVACYNNDLLGNRTGLARPPCGEVTLPPVTMLYVGADDETSYITPHNTLAIGGTCMSTPTELLGKASGPVEWVSGRWEVETVAEERLTRRRTEPYRLFEMSWHSWPCFKSVQTLLSCRC